MKKWFLLFGISILALACSGDDGGGCGAAKASERGSATFANGCGIAVSPKGRIAVTVYNGGYGQSGQVMVYKNWSEFKSGQAPQVSLAVTAPEAVAFDSDENLYVAETEAVAAVRVYNSNDYYFILNRVIQMNFVNPRGLAVDNQDRLYVCDDGNGRIVRFNNPSSSNDYVELTNQGAGLKGIAISGDKMYVTNYSQNRVTAYGIGPDESVINATLGSVTVEKATDISARGNKIVVTSFDTGKITVLSGCDFTDANRKEFSLGQCFGTAFFGGGKVLGAFYAEDLVKELAVN